MATAYTLWPYVGGGPEPLRMTFVPRQIQAQARLCLNGMMCFDPATGRFASGNDPDAIRVLTSAETQAAWWHQCLVAYDATDLFYDRARADIAPWSQPVCRTLEDLLAESAAMRSAIITRLASAFPQFDWASSPDNAAVETIGLVPSRTVQAVGFLAFDHYRRHIIPGAATPEWVDGLITSPGTDSASFSTTLAAALDGGDTLNRAIRVADACWQVIMLGEAVERLPEYV